MKEGKNSESIPAGRKKYWKQTCSRQHAAAVICDIRNTAISIAASYGYIGDSINSSITVYYSLKIKTVANKPFLSIAKRWLQVAPRWVLPVPAMKFTDEQNRSCA